MSYNIKLILINSERIKKEKAFVNCFKCWKLKKMIIVDRYSIKNQQKPDQDRINQIRCQSKGKTNSFLFYGTF